MPSDLKAHDCLCYSNVALCANGALSLKRVGLASRGQRTVKRQQRRCYHSRGIERVGLGHFADLHGRQRSNRYAKLQSDRFVAQYATVNAVYPHSRHLSPKVRAFVDFLRIPLVSSRIGIWCQHYSAGLTRVLDRKRPEPSAKRTHLGFEPTQNYPQVWGGFWRISTTRKDFRSANSRFY